MLMVLSVLQAIIMIGLCYCWMRGQDTTSQRQLLFEENYFVYTYPKYVDQYREHVCTESGRQQEEGGEGERERGGGGDVVNIFWV